VQLLPPQPGAALHPAVNGSEAGRDGVGVRCSNGGLIGLRVGAGSEPVWYGAVYCGLCVRVPSLLSKNAPSRKHRALRMGHFAVYSR
jgi:hypothetical protein